ncbi:MAG: histidinol-phosphatase [Gemmatimonadota bacterium]|nr:histidinol-phosphatase [Gemmatimonadota bacterium]
MRLTILAAMALTVSCAGTPEPQWWKGNLHTHSLWSDGDDYPELIVDWYKRHGYAFIGLSDHNVLAEGERWVEVIEHAGGVANLDAYIARFGRDWVEEREDPERHVVRLKTLNEYRDLFEERNRFLVLQSEEITDRFDSKPIHVNATNILELIEPRGGGSVREVMQNNVDAVFEQRRRTGRPMFPHINHPNYGWAVSAEDLIHLERERFFEVYNGHPAVHNEGDSLHPSAERLWDIILAERLNGGREMMFGVAVDDAHNYRALDSAHSNPGRGWVMVRSSLLRADSLVAAMERGAFYSSTGVELATVSVTSESMFVAVEPEADVGYTIQFIGTRGGYPPPMPIETPGDGASVRYLYDAAIGEVLAEVAGTSASYSFVGEELYVRAKVMSSKPKENPYRPGEVEVAWTQPVRPERR